MLFRQEPGGRICCLQINSFQTFIFFLQGYFFPTSQFLLQIREKQKRTFCTASLSKLSLDRPLPQSLEAATFLLSLAKVHIFHMPQDHLPVAPSDLQGNWFPLSQLSPGWLPCMVGLLSPKKQKPCCRHGALAQRRSSVVVEKEWGGKGCSAQPVCYC